MLISRVSARLTTHVARAMPAARVMRTFGMRTFAVARPKVASDSTQVIDWMYSASQGDVSSLEDCLKRGTDVGAKDYDGRTALHVAAAEGQTAVIQLLLSRGAPVNPLSRNNMTPLEDAVRNGRLEAAALLKSQGGIIDPSRISACETQMLDAAAKDNLGVLRTLIAAGVSPGCKDYDDRTPLHVGAAEGHVAVVEALLAAGVNPNPLDRWGGTPLHDTSRGQSRGHVACFKVLQEAGGVIMSKEHFTGPLLETSVNRSLAHLCERGNFAFAEVFFPNQSQSDFIQTGVYPVAHGSLLSDLKKRTVPNEGGIAQAWQQLKAVVVDDLSTIGPAAPAKQAGLVQAVIVPILHEGRSHGLIFFYGKERTTLTAEDLTHFTEFARRILHAGFYGMGTPAEFPDRPGCPSSLQNELWKMVVAEGVFDANLAYHEVDWFCGLGFGAYYWTRYTPKVLSNHVHSYIGAKKLAATAGDSENLWLHIENNPVFLGGLGAEQALIMCPNVFETQLTAERLIERRIGLVPSSNPYTFESLLSLGPIVPRGTKRLTIYLLETATYVNPNPVSPKETSVWDIASDVFLRDKTPKIRARYQEIIRKASDRLSPTMETYDPMEDGTIPVMIAFTQGSTANYLLQMSELMKQHNLIGVRKFIETFSNGMIVYSLYFQPAPRQAIANFLASFSMLHLIPQSELTALFMDGRLSAEAYTYCSSASRFAYYFINQRSEEFTALNRALANDPLNLGRLRMLYTSMKRESVSLARIYDVVLNYPTIMQKLVADFIQRCGKNADLTFPENTELTRLIQQQGNSIPMDAEIMTALAHFNRAVRRTNFFKTRKSALSFRLDPQFLQFDVEWPTVPYGLYFVMASDFHGFHIRFRDVARGGIRIIRSRDRAQYNSNLASLFAENYGLAYTQNKKNKDIPEFGAKGTILLGQQAQGNSTLAFRKYIAGLVDLLVSSSSVVDNLKKPEILFLGPDEGTAHLMESAALYARDRGYQFWRAFTTGKPPSLGGIPHDTYGMTTRSVHRYVLGCLRKLNMSEQSATKIQTGGPDGDLGSNEIKISHDKTKAVIDGSGVIYDPVGLDRAELTRLAEARQMIDSFDVSKLNEGGFRVLISDKNITLPSGEFVESGFAFRNEFHLHKLAEADLFVPCGGRPESVTLSNVQKMCRADGTPKFKIIVEGANLFCTNDARMVLEQKGVILFKDASTNKGGVTSSSLEVLAALAMDEVQFQQHMAVEDEQKPPLFYQAYVKEIQTRIERDADLEFECIWREHARTGELRHRLTDVVSDKINDLNDFVAASHLWNNLALRREVLLEAVPKTLTDLLGLDQIQERVPEAYLRALFAAYLASRYIYTKGIGAGEFGFFEFMQPFFEKLRKRQKAIPASDE